MRGSVAYFRRGGVRSCFTNFRKELSCPETRE
uniref:Uncharacterized protein n=1 Tax=Lepeophtheirus salmonis TaxID=72036 RepID=A0A0K2TUW1_LEPSM